MRPTLLISLAIILILLLSACDDETDWSQGRGAAGRGNVGGDLVVLYESPPEREFRNSYLYPAGGFLLCRDDQAKLGSIARLDPDGNELWRTKLIGTTGVEVLHVDDGGRIYVTSRDHQVQVLDKDGTILWTREHCLPKPEARWFGTAEENDYLVSGDELLCLDSAGDVVWSQVRPGRGRHLDVRRSADGDRVLYAGTEFRDESDAGNAEIVLQVLDGNGEALWNVTEMVHESKYNTNYVGRFRCMPDGRNFMIVDNRVLELEIPGGLKDFALLGPNRNYTKIFYDGDMYLSPDGNYIFVNNNCDMSGNSIDMLEFDRAGELLHSHSIEARHLGYDPERAHDGVGYYDIQSGIFYFYIERDLHSRRGDILVVTLQNEVLAEYDAGNMPVTRFIRRDDGTILAHHFGGSLLVLPDPGTLPAGTPEGD